MSLASHAAAPLSSPAGHEASPPTGHAQQNASGRLVVAGTAAPHDAISGRWHTWWRAMSEASTAERAASAMAGSSHAMPIFAHASAHDSKGAPVNQCCGGGGDALSRIVRSPPLTPAAGVDEPADAPDAAAAQ